MLTKVMFQCSRVYTSDENRYCMEYLANLLKTALTKKLITQDDLYTNESSVIKNICKDKELSDKWEAFYHFHQVDISHNKKAGYYKINAKHRYFNPMIGNQRIINQSPKFKSELNSFLEIILIVMLKLLKISYSQKKQLLNKAVVFYSIGR